MDIECGKVEQESPEFIKQLIHRMGLYCELCFLLKNVQTPAIMMLNGKVKVDQLDQTKSIPSRITLCKMHFDEIKTNAGQDQYHSESHVTMEQIQELHLKTAKQLPPTNFDLYKALQSTSTNFCCRTLKQRYQNIIKAIQLLEANELSKSLEHVGEQKKIVLQQTEQKFKLYTDNKEKMTVKQKFLMYKWYQELEAKTAQNYNWQNKIPCNELQSALMYSCSIFFEEQ